MLLLHIKNENPGSSVTSFQIQPPGITVTKQGTTSYQALKGKGQPSVSHNTRVHTTGESRSPAGLNNLTPTPTPTPLVTHRLSLGGPTGPVGGSYTTR